MAFLAASLTYTKRSASHSVSSRQTSNILCHSLHHLHYSEILNYNTSNYLLLNMPILFLKLAWTAILKITSNERLLLNQTNALNRSNYRLRFTCERLFTSYRLQLSVIVYWKKYPKKILSNLKNYSKNFIS